MLKAGNELNSLEFFCSGAHFAQAAFTPLSLALSPCGRVIL
jgi:hypothetical protein